MSDSEPNKATDTTGSAILKYWPILSGLAVVLLSLGAIYSKLEYISKAIDKNDTQFSQINERQSMTTQKIIEMQGQINNVNADNLRNTQSIVELRQKLDFVSDKARWAPGAK